MNRRAFIGTTAGVLAGTRSWSTHVTMVPPGGAFSVQPAMPTEAQPIPDGLNWELFQGPAKRTPFIPQRRQWRGWYDYGGGNLTDWGVHLTDVRQPRNPERVPDTWQYPTFVATLSNAMIPGLDDPREPHGNWFYADRGALMVNRIGYQARPYGPPTAGSRRNPNAPPPPPPIEARRFTDPSGMSEVAESAFGSVTHRHVRNFLDCVNSRQQPVRHTELGFHATLPTLLAIVSVKEGRTVRWDGKSAKTT